MCCETANDEDHHPTFFGLRRKLWAARADLHGADVRCVPADLAIAVAGAGGMGACGTFTMSREQIADWSATVRSATNGAFMMNTWIPDPEPNRDPRQEAKMRHFLADWGPKALEDSDDTVSLDFDAECEAMLAAGPAVMSSIMGLFPPNVVAKMKARGIKWFATVTTPSEAQAAVAAGADVVVAQGAEAGGHRGAFDASKAEDQTIGLFSLLPAVVDTVDVPVIAAGGIGDSRAVAAALLLGASAVQVGTALLRSPEANLPTAWADAIGSAGPEDTVLTRAY